MACLVRFFIVLTQSKTLLSLLSFLKRERWASQPPNFKDKSPNFSEAQGNIENAKIRYLFQPDIDSKTSQSSRPLNLGLAFKARQSIKPSNHYLVSAWIVGHFGCPQTVLIWDFSIVYFQYETSLNSLLIWDPIFNSLSYFRYVFKLFWYEIRSHVEIWLNESRTIHREASICISRRTQSIGEKPYFQSLVSCNYHCQISISLRTCYTWLPKSILFI